MEARLKKEIQQQPKDSDSFREEEASKMKSDARVEGLEKSKLIDLTNQPLEKKKRKMNYAEPRKRTLVNLRRDNF